MTYLSSGGSDVNHNKVKGILVRQIDIPDPLLEEMGNMSSRPKTKKLSSGGMADLDSKDRRF